MNLDDYLHYQPCYLSADQADELLQFLQQAPWWQQDQIHLYGRWLAIPRYQAWFAQQQQRYRYSQLTLHSQGWPSWLDQLCQSVSCQCQYPFNSALANRYEDGQHHMGWHQDDEPELGPDPGIAILSLGQHRDIQFRHRGQTQTLATLPLEHGSLLWMKPGCQQGFQHQIPKRSAKKYPKCRISLTFRPILSKK